MTLGDGKSNKNSPAESLDTNAASTIAAAWNKKINTPAEKDRFWLFPQITAHINLKICGLQIPGSSAGIHERIAAHGPFHRAVSVGCGLARKEANLLSRGTVHHFDLFDLADKRLQVASDDYSRRNLTDRASFFLRNPLSERIHNTYDLVYWNSSLHHMNDVHQALDWSLAALRPGGLLAIYEFVGPSRFQWTDRNLSYVRRFRASLPNRINPYITAAADPWIRRPTIAEMLRRDPSEAADSENILPAVKSLFLKPEIVPFGGALYHFGLNGIYKFLVDGDEWIVSQALLLDDALIQIGENHFASVIAKKT